MSVEGPCLSVGTGDLGLGLGTWCEVRGLPNL